MSVRPQYHTLKDKLRRMASSPHFISYQGDKDTISYAADVIERLTKRVAQLDETIEHLRAGEPIVESGPGMTAREEADELVGAIRHRLGPGFNSRDAGETLKAIADIRALLSVPETEDGA